jgi:hypothetical protein
LLRLQVSTADKALTAPTVGCINSVVQVFASKWNICQGMRHCKLRKTPTVDIFGNAFQHIDEALCTGVNHTGLLQNGQLFRCPCEGTPRLFKGLRKSSAKVVDRPCTRHPSVGKRTDDADDGALSRVGKRTASGARADLCGTCQQRRRYRVNARQRLTDAREKLRQNRPGIAARAINGRIRHRPHQGTHGMAASAQAGAHHRVQRKRKIASSIPIGHRKDIDPIQPFATVDHSTHAGYQGPTHLCGGDVGDVLRCGSSCGQHVVMVLESAPVVMLRRA